MGVRLSPLRTATLLEGLTQRELARRAGVPYFRVNLLTNSRTVPRRDEAERLSRALARPREELFPCKCAGGCGCGKCGDSCGGACP